MRLSGAGIGSRSDRTIRWIYDCGTESQANRIDASVMDLGKHWPVGSDIDVLMVSHFDKDHISGLPTLLPRYRFKNILMPHLPRLVRLLAIVDSIEDESPARIAELLDFANDPVAFIRTRGGEGTRIVLVEAADGDGLPEPISRDGASGDDDGLAVPAWPLKNRDLGAQTYGMAPPGRIDTIASGSAFVWDGLWELVPYVDAAVRRRLLDFDPQATEELSATLGAVIDQADAAGRSERETGMRPDRARMNAAIKDLRDRVYVGIQAMIGRKPNSEDKNAISLMAYMGPLNARHARTWSRMAALNASGRTVRHRRAEISNAPGLLLTGDGGLKEPQDIDRLRDHLRAERIGALGILQVPHHGSRNNFSGHAATWLPAPVNFINADPSGKHEHPDAETLGVLRPSLSGPDPRKTRRWVALVNANALRAVTYW